MRGHRPSSAAHSRVAAALLGALATATLAGCAPSQPPRWAEGGAPLAFASARWDRASGGPVELRSNGQVLVDGDLTFVLDRVGRVANDDYDPYAVLLPDGQLAGTDNRSLGRVGVTNASPPAVRSPSLSKYVTRPSGVTASHASSAPGGVWHGCNGPVLRTCTLITQLVAVASYRGSGGGVGIGVGVGVGVGVGF